MDIFLYGCITTNKIGKWTLIYNRLLSVWLYSHCVNNLLQQKDAVQNHALYLVIFCLFNLEESLRLSLTFMSTLQASYFFRKYLSLDLSDISLLRYASPAKVSPKGCCVPLIASSQVAYKCDSALYKWHSFWSLD